ncbi:hypothetical protein BT96DRAFT_660814 [Gymnopus androsaceus JB14]|uniref:Uncharacterized protein n=1 Tax=Gymnopus androsaceus JB14 TaxID=1447944 RepID=A0A6A4HMA0_9AGAR|nr:hypothetical protein BT96DRAFT_660814 [Gymnopus androsaceus JB14]
MIYGPMSTIQERSKARSKRPLPLWISNHLSPKNFSLASETNVFGGWISEAQAMNSTAGQTTSVPAFGPFKRMVADGRKFTDTTLSTTTYRVEKDEHGVMECFNGPSLVLHYTPPEFNQRMKFLGDRRPNFFHEREFHHYLDIESVLIRPQCLYVPRQLNDPLFEAFF